MPVVEAQGVDAAQRRRRRNGQWKWRGGREGGLSGSGWRRGSMAPAAEATTMEAREEAQAQAEAQAEAEAEALVRGASERRQREAPARGAGVCCQRG